MKPVTYRYKSSVDGTKPLLVDVCYKPARKQIPLIVVMHGYGGGRDPVRPDLIRLAGKGLFAIAPDMRGRGGSAGEFDSGGLDVMDIYDAVQFCCRKFARQIDESNLNIIGYSGGGGNTYSCFVRFPDTFRVAASFFGIPDYRAWHQSRGRVDCNKSMEAALRGKPGRLPAIYAARNATQAAGNNGQTRFHIFWDEEETACPGWMNQEFLTASRASGLRNCIAHQSRERDKVRWHHGYTTNWPELIRAEDLFVPEILGGKVAEPRLPCSGKLVVPGFVVTKHFQIWVQPRDKPDLLGRSGVAEIEYELDGPHAEFRVGSVARGHVVRIIHRSI